MEHLATYSVFDDNGDFTGKHYVYSFIALPWAMNQPDFELSDEFKKTIPKAHSTIRLLDEHDLAFRTLRQTPEKERKQALEALQIPYWKYEQWEVRQ